MLLNIFQKLIILMRMHLNKKLNYDFYSKIIELMLIRKRKHLKLIEVIEENINIINLYYDNLIVKY